MTPFLSGLQQKARSKIVVLYSGLPRSGKNIWKMKFFPGLGKVREFCGWPGKFRKDLERQGKVREFEKNGCGRQFSEIYSLQEEKGCSLR